MSTATKSRYGIPAGPGRWERARLNAATRPNSKNAALYNKRVAIADAADEWCEMNIGARVVFATVRFRNRQEARRTYLCGARCAALQVQLETGDKFSRERVLEGIGAAAMGDKPYEFTATHRWTAYDGEPKEHSYTACDIERVRTLTRAVSCRVCGSQITLDAKPTPEPKPADDRSAYVVTVTGEILALHEAMIVRLTPNELDLLSRYSTRELRVQYAIDHGREVQA